MCFKRRAEHVESLQHQRIVREHVECPMPLEKDEKTVFTWRLRRSESLPLHGC
jgi:hypothetical protein